MTRACLAPERREGADDALRESQHQQQDDDAEQRAPIFGLPHDCPASVANTEAPTIGPVSVWTPPSSTMTRPSIERPTWIVSGEIEPLAKANSPPATPQTRAGNGEAEPVHALDVDADGFGAQRRIAAGAHGVAERREQKAPQQQHADHRQAPASAGNRPRLGRTAAAARRRSRRWSRRSALPTGTPATQTICAKASVSIAR